MRSQLYHRQLSLRGIETVRTQYKVRDELYTYNNFGTWEAEQDRHELKAIVGYIARAYLQKTKEGN